MTMPNGVMEDRPYQAELLLKAEAGNIIICLPTGSGKTFIAFKLIEKTLGKTYGTNQKVVFLANTVPLVHQQCGYFKKLLPTSCRVTALTGEMNVDFWKDADWKNLLNSCDVLVCSTVILYNALCRSFVKWSQISLLILDECHHAKGDDPMGKVMDLYKEAALCASQPVPKVLGLTATVVMGSTKMSQMETEIARLEKRLCCRAVTHSNMEEVLKHATNADIKLVAFTKNSINDPICEDLVRTKSILHLTPKNTFNRNVKPRQVGHHSFTSQQQLYNRKNDILSELEKLIQDVLVVYEELGPYCAIKAAHIKDMCLHKMHQDFDVRYDTDAFNMYEVDERVYIQSVRTSLQMFIMILKAEMEERFKQQTQETSVSRFKVSSFISSKLACLLDLLREKSPANLAKGEEALSGLVFCQRRLTVQVLNSYMKDRIEFCEEFAFIKQGFVLGSNNCKGQDVIEGRKALMQQKETIQKMRAKDINLIFATQVLEEGLDLPSCNLVIRFDGVDTFPSFVQSMGRARMKNAMFYILVPTDTLERDVPKFNGYQQFANRLSKVLSENVDHVGKEFEIQPLKEPTIPSFCPEGLSDSPRITEDRAIPLIHRYCASLSGDHTGTPSPVSWSDMKGGKYVAYLMLPQSSDIKEILEGPCMLDKVSAKRAVYMEACKLLYQLNLLDKNLLPVDPRQEIFDCKFLRDFDEVCHVEECPSTVVKVGTRKNLRWYSKSMPLFALKHASLAPSVSVQVYAIHLELKPLSQYGGVMRYVDNFSQQPYIFLLVTNANLSMVPSFPLYTNRGVIYVEIEACGAVVLMEREFKMLRDFQRFLTKSVYSSNQEESFIDTKDVDTFVTIGKRCNPCSTNLELSKASSFFKFATVYAALDQEISIDIYVLVDANTCPQIDWDLVNELAALNENPVLQKPSDRYQRDFCFNAEDYRDAVIEPWYQMGFPCWRRELLCVEEVSKTMTAESAYAGDRRVSYRHRITNEFSVQIYHPGNPLLECISLGKQRNFMCTKTSEGKPAKLRQYSTLVAPELACISPIPASVLAQGRFLPSILHRVRRLYMAADVREAVARTFNWSSHRGKKEDNASFEMEQNLPESPGLNGGQCNGSEQVCPEAERPKIGSKEHHQIMDLDYIDPSRAFLKDIDNIMDYQCNLKRGKQSAFLRENEDTSDQSSRRDLPLISEISFPSLDSKTNFEIEKGPSSFTIMEALTVSNGNDYVDMEKLEVMGDAVLKLVVSCHIFSGFDTWNEGKMTSLRGRFISNKHLFDVAGKRSLGNMLSGGIFKFPGGWVLPAMTVSENLVEVMTLMETEDTSTSRTTYTRSKLSDKNVADSVEALIGAYFLNGGLDSALRVMSWLGLQGPCPDETTVPYSRDVSFRAKKKEYASNSESPFTFLPHMEELETMLSYKFTNKWILVEALTHPSNFYNRVTGCYERLEFIGDAVLDFLITNYIYTNTKIKGPGQLTDLRSALVNNATFGTLSARYGFHKHVLHFSSPLQKSVLEFCDAQEKNHHEVCDFLTLQTDGETEYVTGREVPKVLGDIFESIAGAIYVDSGYSLDSVWKVFYRLMYFEIASFAKNIPIAPVRELHEMFPQKVLFLDMPPSVLSPTSKVVRVTITDTDICALGMGSTRKLAKQAAAKQILRTYRSQTNFNELVTESVVHDGEEEEPC